MRVRFLAADSFGVRSMATLVETDDVKIGIDLWAALGPRRYGLPPHPLEVYALERAHALLSEVGKHVDVHVITHYHYDHHSPEGEFYEGKRILVKDWEEKINRSQRGRFQNFRWRDVVEKADGRKITFGGTKVEFSPPFPHGEPGTRLGWVIMVFVEENLGFLYTSDVEGPVEEEAVEWILGREPDIVYIDGPLSYMKGYRVSAKITEKAMENVRKVVERVDTVILDHHIARDLRFYEEVEELGVVTASRYHFGDDLPLEAWRKKLWEGMEVPRGEVERRYKV